MSLMLGSVSTAPSWHGLWLRLIEDTTPARGALASALATRRIKPPDGLIHFGWIDPLWGGLIRSGWIDPPWVD